MHSHVLVVLLLLFVVVLVHAASARLRISFPIVLVVVGLGIGFVPWLPRVALDPDVVFLVFLPPLLYEAAWFTSWREFKSLRNAIGLQAVGLVICTAGAIASVAHAAIPGCSWALGFLLGGILAPPDAVAATSVLHGLRIPRVGVAILEGESLVNDASSLVVVRFALAAVTAGTFDPGDAGIQFVWVVIAGVLVGLGIGQALFRLHRLLRLPPEVDVTLTFLSPYLMYLLAEEIHASGVLSVVAGGLLLSSKADRFLEPRSRVVGLASWSTAVFVLNGVVFILIGLQLPQIVADVGRASLFDTTMAALLVASVAIIVRIGWTFAAAFAPSYFPWRPAPRRFPDRKMVALVSWAGMRGVVSLAAALAIPATMPDGSPFPLRSSLIFVTFVVILVALVAQGLSLPLLVRGLRFDLPDDALERRAALEERLAGASATVAGEGDDLLRGRLLAQRAELHRLQNVGEVAHELVRAKEYDLDLELARLDGRRDDATH